VQKLNAEFVKALSSDDVKNKVLPQGVFVTPSTPEELGAMVKRDIVRLGEVVKESGAKTADR
jgi:tripartite-type tricarboxylate transporter receptor subunit TctC